MLDGFFFDLIDVSSPLHKKNPHWSMKEPVLGEQMERNQSHSRLQFSHPIFPFFNCVNSLMSLMSLISLIDGQWRYVTIDRRDHRPVCKSINDCIVDPFFRVGAALI
jgi:hypothetical protein